jgi:hypothetical protein
MVPHATRGYLLAVPPGPSSAGLNPLDPLDLA